MNETELRFWACMVFGVLMLAAVLALVIGSLMTDVLHNRAVLKVERERTRRAEAQARAAGPGAPGLEGYEGLVEYCMLQGDSLAEALLHADDMLRAERAREDTGRRGRGHTADR
jgi:hypothetical protein